MTIEKVTDSKSNFVVENEGKGINLAKKINAVAFVICQVASVIFGLLALASVGLTIGSAASGVGVAGIIPGVACAVLFGSLCVGSIALSCCINKLF